MLGLPKVGIALKPDQVSEWRSGGNCAEHYTTSRQLRSTLRLTARLRCVARDTGRAAETTRMEGGLVVLSYGWFVERDSLVEFL